MGAGDVSGAGADTAPFKVTLRLDTRRSYSDFRKDFEACVFPFSKEPPLDYFRDAPREFEQNVR